MKNAGKVRCSVFPAALFACLGLSLFFAGKSSGQDYPETTWVRVVLYDYHSSIAPYTVAAPDGANPKDTDFTSAGETCVDHAGANGTGASLPVVGMVSAAGLSADRKPIPVTALDCKTAAPLYPCACHLINWFRVSASMNYTNDSGYDGNCVFSCDSGQANPLGGSRLGSPKNPIWYWVQKSGAALPSWKGRTGEYVGPNYDSTNPFANVIVYDSIPFIHQPTLGTAVYQFVADTSTPKIAGSHFPHDSFGFFPLDGRGYGSGFPAAAITDEPDFYGKATYNHNFGYAMEMHNKVLYQRGQGLKFLFAGDDDLWCFINGQLVMDLGGIKSETADSVYLDSLPGLVSGNYYNFDLYYCERNPTGADLKITTNIILVQPKNISTSVPEYDTLMAGDTLPISAYVLDQNGQNVPTKSILIQWAEDTSFRTGDVLLTPQGHVLPAAPNNQDSGIKFTATEALRTANIIASYTSATASFACTTFVYVKPNVPDHIVIENSSTPRITSPNSNNPLGGPTGAITMGSGQIYDTGYVVWRDKFQNYISFDTTVSWSMVPNDTTVVSITPGNKELGEGIIKKGSDTTGKTNIIYASDTNYSARKKDTAQVSVTSIGRGYDTLRIEVFNPTTGAYDTTGLNPLTLQAPDSIILYALAHRTASTRWDLLSVNWGISSNLTATKTAPTSQSSWSVSPVDTGHGYIWISWPVQGGPPNDTIKAVFTAGLPTSLAIYHSGNAPSATNVAFPQSPAIADTFAAGAIDTLYAKLFFNSILYPNTSPLVSQITWTISPAGGDTLLNPTNYFGILSSTQAWRNILVTAKWQSLSSSILCRIKPGAVSRVVIVGSPNIGDSSDVAPLNLLTIASTDSIAYAYGVRVDAYSNFVGYATAAKWNSTNTALTTVASDTVAEGEALIAKRLRSVTGRDSVIAYDTVYGKRDTLPVNCATYTYTSIQICNVQGTPLTGDTVGVGATSTLYAFGTPSNGQPVQLVAVTWSSTGLSMNPAAPSNVNNWAFTADSVGNGHIKISLTQGTSTIVDSIPCVFTAGAASSMVLYRQAGTPLPALIFPVIDTIVSEATDTIDAKLFSSGGLWLSQYETTPTDSVIKWTIVKVSGPAGGGTDTVLATKKGHITSFTPHSAYCLYQITATYSQNGTTLTASAEIYVNPGAATQLIIEATDIQPGVTASNLLNGNHPFDTLRFGATDTSLNVWAVLRDKDSNFVGMCPDANWISINDTTGALDNLIVTAQPGQQSANGEGQVNRAPGATIGLAKVVATNENNLKEFDTLNVALEAYSYSRLLIVVNNTVADSLHSNDTLKIRADQDTSLEVAALLSGSTWSASTSIIADWAYLSNSGAPSQSAANTHEWTFSPGATGNGKIIVSAGSAIQDTINIAVLAGSAASVVLYDSMGPPSPTIVPWPNPVTAVNIVAGTPFLMAAKVFDASGNYLSSYDNTAFNADFRWSAINPPGDSLNPKGDSLNDSLDAGRAGVQQHFVDTRAYDSAYVIVQFDSMAIKDTVLLRVVPGVSSHIVLEKTSAFDLHTPNPCDTLLIPNTSPTGSVYAILRDRFQNAIGYDTTITQVGALNLAGAADTSVISVRLNNPNIGQVLAYRNTPGTAKLFATDAKGLSDTCVVMSLAYGYKALRIVEGAAVGPHIGTPLVLNTNQDSTIYVQALRSDTALWVNVAATWQVSPGLSGLTPPIQQSSSFLIAPTDTGTGWIRVTLGNDSVTTPDTLPVKFTAGGAVQALIKIIDTTPAIAGQPIKAAVMLEDSHGNPVNVASTAFTLASGGGAYYADSRGAGGKPDPFLVVDGTTIKLDHVAPDSCSETFVNGVDTVSFTLYNAPAESSFVVLTHQISVSLLSSATATPITGVSSAFQLFPGPIVSLQMQTAGGTPIHVDTLTDDVPPSNTYFARGYDQYGNLISLTGGGMGSNWHVTGNLHAPTVDTVAVGAVYYNDSTNGVVDSESGYLVAIYDTNNVAYSDSVRIAIIGPSALLVSAITRNLTGDGYLDHLDLIFSKKVQLPSDSAHVADFSAAVGITALGTAVLSIDSIPAMSPDSIWRVALANNRPAGAFQTGWTPNITMAGYLPASLGRSSFTSVDGAGPVIARVVKHKGSNAGNKLDTVTVTFSEQIRALATNSSVDSPSVLFDVWDSTSGGFVLDPTILKGAGTLLSATNDTQAVFLMSNDSNLTLGHYFSIDSAHSAGLVADVVGNLPNANNRKAPVTFNAPPVGPVIVAPNPMRHPGGATSGGSNLQIYDNGNSAANPVVSNNGGGVQMSFDVPVPDSADHGVTVQASVAIYDILGNLVNAGKNTKFIYYTAGNGWLLDNGGSGEPVVDLVGNGTIVRPSIYWSGMNGRGMTVAAGVYRVVVNLHYAGSGKTSYSDQKATANIGVMHGK
jgi:fibro-slime domain-containing protein